MFFLLQCMMLWDDSVNLNAFGVLCCTNLQMKVNCNCTNKLNQRLSKRHLLRVQFTPLPIVLLFDALNLYDTQSTPTAEFLVSNYRTKVSAITLKPHA